MTFVKRGREIFLGAALTLAATAASGQQAVDTDVLGARDAAQRGQWKVVEAYRARLAGHVLEPYVDYWLLAGAIDRSDARDVRAFLARHDGTPLAETLRRDWLKSLGAAGAWETFRAEHPRVLGEDTEIACYSLQERLVRGDPEVATEARAFFLSGREAPAACEPVFAALYASGRIAETQVWERMRKLLAAGYLRDAKRANALLPARVALPDKSLDRAAADPAAYLARERSTLATRGAKELAVYAVARLARTKPDDAAERLAALAPKLGSDTARYAWGQVAHQAALNHHPRALEFYTFAGDATLSEGQIAWKARAAMRASDWKQLLAAIQAMAPEDAREATWRFWRARALGATGETEAAQALLKDLARETSFYGLLAAERIGIAAAPDWNGWRPQPADLERVRAVPGVQRALALYRLQLDAEGLREWLWAMRGLGDRDLLAAAEVARLANVPERAINTADRTVELHDFTQRFPTPHREALAAAARQWDLDEALLYGIIRQESRFVAEARSRVGAMGLMQLMPATARWVARQISIQPFKAQMLEDPELNVQMGAYYFRRVLTDLGHPILATAAYNAGPGRARRWRDARPLEGAVYVETIPFSETRDYVKKVFTNAWFYRHRLTGKTASLRELLGTIAGRGGEAAVASNIP